MAHTASMPGKSLTRCGEVGPWLPSAVKNATTVNLVVHCKVLVVEVIMNDEGRYMQMRETRRRKSQANIQDRKKETRAKSQLFPPPPWSRFVIFAEISIIVSVCNSSSTGCPKNGVESQKTYRRPHSYLRDGLQNTY